MSESPTVINNYSVDIRSVINDYIIGERNAVLNSLLQAGILRNADDGNGLVGFAYVNYENRAEEGHEPQLSVITIGAQPVEELTNDEG